MATMGERLKEIDLKKYYKLLMKVLILFVLLLTITKEGLL